MKQIVNVTFLSALALLAGCAPSVKSHKDSSFAFPSDYYRILVQEGKGDAEYVQGLDTVAMKVFAGAGLSLSTYYNRRIDLEPHTLKSMRHEDSTGYVMILALDSVVYKRGVLLHRIYSAELYDMPSQKMVWDSQVFLRNEPSEHDQVQVCSTFVAQARKDRVFK